MRRYSGGLVSRRSRGAVAPAAALVAAAMLAAAAAPAGATITPVTHDNAGALNATNAAIAAGLPALNPQGPAFFLAVPPAGNPVAVADAASGLPVPAQRDGVPRPLDGRRGPGRPARPGRDVPRASDDGQAKPISAGRRQRRRHERAADQLQRDRQPDRRLSRLRLALPLGGVPLAPRQRLQRRLRGRDGCNDLGRTASGPSILAPGNFAALPNGQPLTINSGDRLPAMSPAEAAGTPYGAATACSTRTSRYHAGAASHALPLGLRSRRQRCRQRCLHRRHDALDAGGRLYREPVAGRPRRGHHGPGHRRDGGHADAHADPHGDQGPATSRSGSTRAPPRRAPRCRRWRPCAPATRGRCPRRCWPRVSTRRRPRRPGPRASTA